MACKKVVMLKAEAFSSTKKHYANEHIFRGRWNSPPMHTYTPFGRKIFTKMRGEHYGSLIIFQKVAVILLPKNDSSSCACENFRKIFNRKFQKKIIRKIFITVTHIWFLALR